MCGHRRESNQSQTSKSLLKSGKGFQFCSISPNIWVWFSKVSHAFLIIIYCTKFLKLFRRLKYNRSKPWPTLGTNNYRIYFTSRGESSHIFIRNVSTDENLCMGVKNIMLSLGSSIPKLLSRLGIPTIPNLNFKDNKKFLPIKQFRFVYCAEKRLD